MIAKVRDDDSDGSICGRNWQTCEILNPKGRADLLRMEWVWGSNEKSQGWNSILFVLFFFFPGLNNEGVDKTIS